MKTLIELRTEYNQMNEQEIQIELLIAQVRMARATESTAIYLEKISDSIKNFRLY